MYRARAEARLPDGERFEMELQEHALEVPCKKPTPVRGLGRGLEHFCKRSNEKIIEAGSVPCLDSSITVLSVRYRILPHPFKQ
jgi:hypothetical protein